MLLIGILLAPRIGLVSCEYTHRYDVAEHAAEVAVEERAYADRVRKREQSAYKRGEFSLATLLGSVDAFVAAFFVAFLLKGKKP